MREKIIIILLVFLAQSAYADKKLLSQADIDYGQHLSSECVTCHHKAGLNKGIPSISGMDAEVFIALMLAYRAKEMENPVMQMIAGRLDENQIASLALYFSKLK
tara:strand:+ start:210 stop:521 length:312 start_codon:yes stop_codon:yes gene_type:complete